MREEKIRPRSRRKSGSDQTDAMAFAVRLLPHPCTPSSRSPFGAGRPNLRAGSLKAPVLPFSHPFSSSRPPTCASSCSTLTNSNKPLLRITCRFSSSTRRMSSLSSTPSLAMALAKAFSASLSVRPWAALMICSACSRVSSTRALFPRRTTVTISLRSWYRSRNEGRGTSRTETSFSSSTGMVSTGASRITVVKVDLRSCASSRIPRTTAALSRKGWKSLSTTSDGSVSLPMAASASTGSRDCSLTATVRPAETRRIPRVTDHCNRAFPWVCATSCRMASRRCSSQLTR